MAFSTAGNREPLAEVNVTPLVDVMLVLLIIVTVPMLTRAITVNLQQRSDLPQRQLEPPAPLAFVWVLVARRSGTPAWRHCRSCSCG
ncbi:biopolymer transport protein ExbD [Xanthomonas arboricola]